MSIDLRLSNVNPPAGEPKRTIYRDIVNLPDPVKLGITIRYFNYDDVTLYFKITGSGTGYTFGTVALGALTSGTNAYINLDEFASRAKPSAETTETVTITLNAYTDAGYANLKWTFSRDVTVVFIKSNDPSYTQDELDNFDDGTVQGWANDRGYSAGFGVQTDYVLSPAYSLGNCTDGSSADWAGAAIVVFKDSVTLIQIGILTLTTQTTWYIPHDKWIRLVVPLPASSSFALEVMIYPSGYPSLTYQFGCKKSFTTSSKSTHYAIIDLRVFGSGSFVRSRIDDFKIISK